MSYFSNLHYSHDGIGTWRACDIGSGKSVPWTKFSIPEEFELPTIEASPSMSEASASFVSVRQRRTGGHSPVTEEEGSSESDDESSETLSSATNCRLFTSPEEGCIKSFMRHSSLVKHLDCAKHKRKLEHETLYDKAIIEYATKLDYGVSKIPVVVEGGRSSIPTSVTLRMGWALKSTPSRRTKFTDKQKQYLNVKYWRENREDGRAY